MLGCPHGVIWAIMTRPPLPPMFFLLACSHMKSLFHQTNTLILQIETKLKKGISRSVKSCHHANSYVKYRFQILFTESKFWVGKGKTQYQDSRPKRQEFEHLTRYKIHSMGCWDIKTNSLLIRLYKTQCEPDWETGL